MKPSVPGILCILLSCLLASCAPINNTPDTSSPGNLTIYPNLQRNVLHPEDSVIFEFTLTGAGIDINAVKINTGEPGAPLFQCGRNAACTDNAIRVKYNYKTHGYYNVSVQHNGDILTGKRILIVENYLTDEELRYKAIKEIAAELGPVLHKVTQRGKVAFSALKDANFEYAEDQKDVEIIYGLMQALVERNTGRSNYVILERAPQALVRLAHEAVYTAKSSTSAPEKTQLEYGLYTSNEGLKRPLVYGIKSSGLDDTLSRVEIEGGADSIREGTSAQRGTPRVNQARSTYAKKQGKFIQEARRERPVMFARFDTADFLVVIERLEDDDRSGDELVERSKQDYYDTTYNAKAIKRTAKIKINVRILNDNGRIMWVKNITKQASDLVMPDYAPSIQTWTERKNRRIDQVSVMNSFPGLGTFVNTVAGTVADTVTGTVNLIRTK